MESNAGPFDLNRGDFASKLLKFDYITAIFNTFIMSIFSGDFHYEIVYKTTWKLFQIEIKMRVEITLYCNDFFLL